MRQKNTGALIFIFITVVIDTIGLGIIIPVLPSLIKELIGGDLSEASRYGGWLMFAYASTQFAFAPLIGNLSDKYGRRSLLLSTMFCFGINYLLMGLAPTVVWLFIGRLIAGITGASHTVAAAYIADVSTPQKKAQNFGLLGAAFGIGFIIGPVLGGLLGQYGARIPFFAAAGLSILNFIYGFFIVPESLSKENRRKFDWRKANPVGSFKHFTQYPVILPLLVCIFLINLAAHAVQTTWSYYTMEQFAWDERMVGISLGFIGVLLLIIQAGLLRLIIPRLGALRTILLGITALCFAFPIIGFAGQSWVLFLASIPYVFGGIASPTLQSEVSNHTPVSEQGQLQGGVASIISLTSIIGPPMMSSLFAHYTKVGAAVYFPGAPFLLAGCLAVLALLVVFFYFKASNKTANAS